MAKFLFDTFKFFLEILELYIALKLKNMFNREPVGSSFSPLLFGLHSSETSHTLVF